MRALRRIVLLSLALCCALLSSAQQTAASARQNPAEEKTDIARGSSSDTAAARGAVPIALELGTAAAFATASPSFVGTTFGNNEWSAGEREWKNTSLLGIDLDDPKLRAELGALAPGAVRVGGGTTYALVFDVHGTECAATGALPLQCVTMPRWREILAFFKDTGVKLVYGLPAQNRTDGRSLQNVSLSLLVSSCRLVAS